MVLLNSMLQSLSFSKIIATEFRGLKGVSSGMGCELDHGSVVVDLVVLNFFPKKYL